MVWYGWSSPGRTPFCRGFLLFREACVMRDVEVCRCYDCGGLTAPIDEDFDQAVCRCQHRRVKYPPLVSSRLEIDARDVLSLVHSR